VVAALGAHPGVAALGVSTTTRTMAAHAMFAAHGELETLAEADRSAINQLYAAGGNGSLLIQVPLMRDDVHDVGRLVNLEQWLLA
jgi:hypothetical protein